MFILEYVSIYDSSILSVLLTKSLQHSILAPAPSRLDKHLSDIAQRKVALHHTSTREKQHLPSNQTEIQKKQKDQRLPRTISPDKLKTLPLALPIAKLRSSLGENLRFMSL